LRKRIGYLVPGSFKPHEDVGARSNTGIAIDGADCHFGDFTVMGRGKRGSAFLAEAPLYARGGVVPLDELFTGCPPKLVRTDNHPGDKGGAMRFPADGTVAVSHHFNGAVDCIVYRITKTTSGYGHFAPSNPSNQYSEYGSDDQQLMVG
jgi:hypothetical protein